MFMYNILVDQLCSRCCCSGGGGGCGVVVVFVVSENIDINS